jgi:hypothetical protein
VKKLVDYNINVDLAGFLTPWALHSFKGKLEKTINRLDGLNARKFIPTKENQDLVFYEQHLYNINKQKHLKINDIYLLSLHHGVNDLLSEMQELIDNKNYDLIIAVDVGGDILARKQDLHYVFTPIVDKTCLYLLDNLKTEAKKIVAIIAPGIDGELPKKNIKEIFRFHRKSKSILHEEDIKNDINFKYLILALNELNKKIKFSGNTIKILSKIAKNKTDFKEIYIKKIKIGNKKWNIKFPVILDSKLANKVFYISLEKIKKITKFNLNYHNIIEAFKFFNKLNVGGTEVDLTYVPKKIFNGKYNESIFIPNIFNRVLASQKEEIIKYIRENEIR